MIKNFYSQAIARIRPGSNWGMSYADQLITDAKGDITNLEWYDESTTKPTVQEIEAAAQICFDEWTANQYQEKREREYPPLSDLADALYWQAQGDDSKMTAYLAAVQAVKDKYPKG